MMGLRLTVLEHVPASLYRGYVLRRLTQATTEAFSATAPTVRGARFADRLAGYAGFTAACAEAAAADLSRADTVRERLHSNAAALGAGVRRRLGISSPEEALRTLKVLYGLIGIEITPRGDDAPSASDSPAVPVVANAGGSLIAPCIVLAFPRCFFAALFGGASLRFLERLTGGRPCCRATVTLAEARS